LVKQDFFGHLNTESVGSFSHANPLSFLGFSGLLTRVIFNNQFHKFPDFPEVNKKALAFANAYSLSLSDFRGNIFFEQRWRR